MIKFSSQVPKLGMKFLGVKYGKNMKLVGWPFVFKFPGSEITIGDNCCVNSSFMSNLLGLHQRTILVARYGGKITIGNNVGMSGVTIYSWNKINIGDNTLIGANTKIIDTDFHPIDSEMRKKNEFSGIKTAPINIGTNVFVGCEVIITKGTNIGNNCVIGAGSVVHGTFGDNVVIAGNPAKVIRTLENN